MYLVLIALIVKYVDIQNNYL